MTDKTPAFPRFHHKFLDTLAREFERRRKALSYHGELAFDFDPSADLEYCCVRYDSRAHPSVTLRIVENQLTSLTVRSSRRNDRGKMLFLVEDLIVERNAVAIVKTFEWTIAETYAWPTPVPNSQIGAMKRRWLMLEARNSGHR